MIVIAQGDRHENMICDVGDLRMIFHGAAVREIAHADAGIPLKSVI